MTHHDQDATTNEKPKGKTQMTKPKYKAGQFLYCSLCDYLHASTEMAPCVIVDVIDTGHSKWVYMVECGKGNILRKPACELWVDPRDSGECEEKWRKAFSQRLSQQTKQPNENG